MTLARELAWLARIQRRDRFAFRFECVLFGIQAALVPLMLCMLPVWWMFAIPIVGTVVLVRDMRTLSWREPA